MIDLLITVEHATNRLPVEVFGLGLSAATLSSHVAWDPGALELGRALHARVGGELLVGEWSRLLVDLNRSATSPRVAPAWSFGVAIPGNAALTEANLRLRLERYWRPFRERARAFVAQSKRCVHIGMHTFTPELGDDKRDFDVAALYDPRRPWERDLAGAMVRQWRQAGWQARRNAPYRGVADGHTTALRKDFPDGRYAGIEIEVNQRGLGIWDRVTAAVVDGTARALGLGAAGDP